MHGPAVHNAQEGQVDHANSPCHATLDWQASEIRIAIPHRHEYDKNLPGPNKMDIRSRPIQEWGRLLRERWPRPMAASLGWTQEEGSVVTCVIIVMKMVISYTDKALSRGGNELESVRAQIAAEEKNILLKYAWHDTSVGAEEIWAIEPTAVLRLQEEVYTELTDPQGQWARALSGGLTFERLMESPPMWKHFWSRPEFRMRVGFEVEQKDGWVPLKRVLSDDGVTPVSATTLAKQSLVRWCPDDRGLPKHLLRPPIKLDDEGVRFRQVQGWSLGMQGCIRVLYKMGTGQTPAGFQDLVGLGMTPRALDIGQDGCRWVDGVQIDYQIIAAVRLGPPVYIRTYDKSGKYSVPKALSSQVMSCLDNDWELGQSGSDYMLYYVRVKSSDAEFKLGDEKPPKISESGMARAAQIGQTSVALPAFYSPPPPTAPKEPKALRDRGEGRAAAGKPGPSLSEVNRVPVGSSRAARFGESFAGSAGQHGEPERDARVAAPPAMKKSSFNPQGFDPRPRSDQLNVLQGPPKPAVAPPVNPRAQHENAGAQPRRNNDPRRRADEPGGPDSAQPHMWYASARGGQPSKKRRRLEEDDM